jgi:hypothetical protein
MVKNPLMPIEMTSFDSSVMTAGYKVINADGLDEACCVLRITNDSTLDVTISFDGTKDHDYLCTGDVLQISAPPSLTDRANFAKGVKVYLKGAAGQGCIYLSGYYRPLGG